MLPISRYAETQVDTVLDRRDKDTMREEACSFMSGIQYKYTVQTLSLMAHFSCVTLFTLQDMRRNGNTVNKMKKKSHMFGDILASDRFHQPS